MSTKDDIKVILIYLKKLFNWKNLILFFIVGLILYFVNLELITIPFLHSYETKTCLTMFMFFVWFTFVISYSYIFLQKNKFFHLHKSIYIKIILSFLSLILITISYYIFIHVNSQIYPDLSVAFVRRFYILLLLLSFNFELFSFMIKNYKINYIIQIANVIFFMTILFFLLRNDGKPFWNIYYDQIIGALLSLIIVLTFSNYIMRTKYFFYLFKRKKMQ